VFLVSPRHDDFYHHHHHHHHHVAVKELGHLLALTDPEVSVVVLLVCTCCQCGRSGYVLCPVSLVFMYFV
jgi:hypothetical protein